MSIFTKPLSQLEAADLQELLADRAIENVRLEFKSQAPDKDETLKKLSSFANTFGGLMVVGAKANSADGRIQDLPGVDPVDGYKQKVIDWCFGGCSPPLTVEVSEPISVSSSAGKVCYAIHVPESDLAPHFLNGRKGAWIRTDEFSSRFEAHLANESELRHLLDRRKLVRENRARILQRARQRFDSYVAKTHTDRSGNRVKFGSALEFSIVPRFPARSICQQERLSHHIQQSWINWRQILFPDPGSPILSQHESAIVLNAMKDKSIFEVNVWGMVYYAVRIDEDHNGTHGIHVGQFVGNVLLFIRHANKMLEMMGYSGPILIETTLASIRDVPWLTSANGRWLVSKAGSELDDEVAFSIDTSVEELHEGPDTVAMEVLRYALFSVGSPSSVETQDKLAQLVRWGYEYNFWFR
jgi:hypothetical protein